MGRFHKEIVNIALFRENGCLTILHGEKMYAPNVGTLIGGKSGDVDNQLNERHNPWIALYREMEEESGYPVAPRNLVKVFDMTYPDKGKINLMHVFTGVVTDLEFKKMKPPEGVIKTCDINSLNSDPMKNVHCPISPLHTKALMFLQDHKNRAAQTVHYVVNESFMPIEDYAKAMASLQRRLQPR